MPSGSLCGRLRNGIAEGVVVLRKNLGEAKGPIDRRVKKNVAKPDTRMDELLKRKFYGFSQCHCTTHALSHHGDLACVAKCAQSEKCCHCENDNVLG